MRLRRATAAGALVIAVLGASSCGDGDSAKAPVAVLSAFPAEIAAVLEHATVDETRTIDGRVFRIGRIGRAPVVIGMTGIGLVNARDTTKLLLDSFELSGVVVSGVAGSPLDDADVTVSSVWMLDDGSSYSCDRAWLDEAAEVAQAGAIALQSCAIIPEVGGIPGAKAGDRICFPYIPRVVVGGVASSSDPYGGKTFACTPDGNDVFGCDRDPPSAVVPSPGGGAVAELVRVGDDTKVAYDMETAAIAREVTARGLPFIAFRASSDGGVDPLNLTDFTEFFAYYRLAAYNAAAAAAAFVDRAS